MGRVTENMYLKSWREAYICSGARREGYENKKFQVFLWPHKDHRYCYYEQEKYFEKNKRMKILTEFLFG